ncbi:hypothetical protein CTAYLR_004679 [Chrysophaeum taylorii]|uniref:Uncharacterized protein n=1 Tax=Chrysophaeum taylorii TaxID=2483200 RepID=A0AAD7XIH1_9STRA|nr:hypothetical protein CTAYLR_004679 [Chrysophaeum taylorii]
MFKKPPTAKEQAKQVKREVKHSQRDIDRELRDFDRREQQLIAEIRREAKLGRSEKAVQILAKQLVQLRQSRDRMIGARANMGAIATHASAMASHVAVSDAIGSAGKVMGAMNKTLDSKKIGLTMQQFQRETEKMNMSEEAMADMLSDAFDTDETEDESNAVVDQVLADIGVEITAGLQDAPTTKIPDEKAAVEEPVGAESDKHLADLQAQLNAL